MQTDRIIQHLTMIEEKAEEILVDRSEIIALEKRRNSNREGIRALEKQKCSKTWMAFGPTLIKLPNSKVKQILEKDQVTVSNEVNKLRSNLKIKVSEMNDLEYKPNNTGFSLKPLTKKEMEVMKQILNPS